MHLRGTRFSPLSSVQDPPMPHHLRSRRQLSSICIIIHLQGMSQCMSGSFLYPCSSRFAYETFAAVVGGCGWESGVCDRTAGGMRVISRVKTCSWNTGLFPCPFPFSQVHKADQTGSRRHRSRVSSTAGTRLLRVRNAAASRNGSCPAAAAFFP